MVQLNMGSSMMQIRRLNCMVMLIRIRKVVAMIGIALQDAPLVLDLA